MFTQTDPKDNPQPGDKDRNPDGSRIAPRVAGPGDRPLGSLGVDRPHGGGSTGTEQMAMDRAPADAQPAGTQPGPGHNPNNPQDTNNIFSTSTGPANRDNPLAGYATGEGGPAEVTTDPLPTRNEQIDRQIKDAKAKQGKAKKKSKAKSRKAKSASSRTKRASAAKSRSKSGSKAKARKRSS